MLSTKKMGADDKIFLKVLDERVTFSPSSSNSANCRDLTLREINAFPCDIEMFSAEIRNELMCVEKKLMRSFQANSERKVCFYKATGKVEYDEYYPKFSKPIIDEIDELLAKHYGFTEEELDFIINYDIKYRMGDELNAE